MGRYKDDRSRPRFEWADLGDVVEGRPTLGLDCPVQVYRLFQYTLRDVLITHLGPGAAQDLFREAGRMAGAQLCHNLLDTALPLDGFLAQLQQVLRELRIGVLRVEKADPDTLELLLTVSEDLDCSGLPVTDEVVCDYDEGFIAGILAVYVGQSFQVREVDCWASGGRVCRFEAHPAALE
jgi:predicted hydrocarbon binding protein